MGWSCEMALALDGVTGPSRDRWTESVFFDISLPSRGRSWPIGRLRSQPCAHAWKLQCECTRLDAGEEDLAHQPVRHASRTPVSRDASKRSPERPPSLLSPLKARSSPAGALEQRWRALPRHRYGPLNPCSSGTNYSTLRSWPVAPATRIYGEVRLKRRGR